MDPEHGPGTAVMKGEYTLDGMSGHRSTPRTHILTSFTLIYPSAGMFLEGWRRLENIKTNRVDAEKLYRSYTQTETQDQDRTSDPGAMRQHHPRVTMPASNKVRQDTSLD